MIFVHSQKVLKKIKKGKGKQNVQNSLYDIRGRIRGFHRFDGTDSMEEAEEIIEAITESGKAMLGRVTIMGNMTTTEILCRRKEEK